MADHNRDLPVALNLIQAELPVRGDVYTWDAYSWVLYKSGRLEEAKTGLAKSIALAHTRTNFLRSRPPNRIGNCPMMKNILFFFVSAALLLAHPMGNFSVNHYAKLQPSPNGVELEYVLDLAEIPTFETLARLED